MKSKLFSALFIMMIFCFNFRFVEGQPDESKIKRINLNLNFPKISKEKKDKDKDNVELRLLPFKSEEIQKLFLKAIVNNDTSKVRFFLNNGASINISKCYDEEIDINYDYYDVNYEKYSDYLPTPLALAIYSNSKDVVNQLINYDLICLMPSCIIPVIRKGDIVIFDIILNTIFNPENQRNSHIAEVKRRIEQSNYADLAIRLRQIDIFEKLISKGLKFSKANISDLLIDCSKDCNISLCKYLIIYGADVNYVRPKENSNYIYEKPKMAISEAAFQGCYEIVKLIIESGCDVNKGFFPPLYYAVARPNNTDFITYLIKKGADVNYTDSFMGSVLKHSREEYKELLIINGAK